MANIPITGMPSSFRVPVSAIEIVFAQGASGAPGGQRDILYAMPILSTGTWTAGNVYEVRNADQAKDGGGVGSAAHRCALGHFASSKLRCYMLAVAETTGGSSEVQADATITIGVTTAATALWKAWICGEQVSAKFTSSDTATTAGDKVAAAINAKSHLPCTAANVTGTVTVTARHNGTMMGDGTTGVIRIRSEVEPGKGWTTTDEAAALGLGTGETGADGSTTQADQLATALANVDAARYYYLGICQWDSTSLTNLQSHISTKSDPFPGLRCRGFAGYTGTLASAQTLAIARNYERMHVIAQPNSEWDPAKTVGHVVALLAKHESRDSTVNLSGYSGPDWQVPPAYSEADWPTLDDQNDAVTDGVMLVGSRRGASFLVMHVSTRSKTSAGGSVDDFRATEGHRVSGMDELADTWIARDQIDLAGKKLMRHPRDADGVVDVNFLVPRGTITDYVYKKSRMALLDEFGPSGKNVIQDVAAWKESLDVDIDPENPARIEAGASGRVVDHANQSSVRLAETNPG